ncbi:hypothetical protein CKO25_16065 [Thiocapsa imhoffii]|uniref:EAL domain-containing protein n=2 Tax=Thiocapsa imhoffii TaxID=382777 RepID=A0A9X0WKN0_9GAMM|nr:EAL domain-containing protein [Thiocapsa imhoffii]MBK1646134.1 hypothetical protein [Thiocapsa imhoffii]
MQDLRIHQIELDQQNRELREAQHALEISRDRYAHLYDWAPVGYCTLDHSGLIREINLTAASLFGVERTRLLGSPLRSHLDRGQGPALRKHLERVRRTGQRQTLIAHLTSAQDGQTFELRLDSEPAVADDGTPVCLTVLLDTTEQRRLLDQLKAREQELSFLALHDSLTGLPNRSLFEDRLKQAIADARRDQHRVAVFFVDLDRFKSLNDRFGHAFGDRILKLVAKRLCERVRQRDSVARIGGDEFLMLFAPLQTMDAAGLIGQKLIDAMSQPFTGLHGAVQLSVSIGISMYPDDGVDAVDLIRHADAAMYIAKGEGRSTFRFYRNEMTKLAYERVRLLACLHKAVVNGELVLLFQPQLALDSRRILGVEALVRWEHPLLGLLPPERFLPLAEETGLIGDIDRWVLRAACTQRKRWQAAGLDEMVVLKVNLSQRQLEQPGFVESLDALLRELDLDPQLLCLELKEQVFMAASSATMATLHRLKALDVGLSIDQFGGVSSAFGEVRRLPISELKIDKSVIDGLVEGGDDAAIAKAILAFGMSLGMRVVALGVETEGQAQLLRQAGFTSAQGDLYAAPVDTEQLMAFVKSWT